MAFNNENDVTEETNFNSVGESSEVTKSEITKSPVLDALRSHMERWYPQKEENLTAEENAA